MGRNVKKSPEPTFGGMTLAELRELVSTQVADGADDPDVFTRAELEKAWGTKTRKTMEMLHELAALGKAEPIMAKRPTLHGVTSVKAYRIKA